MNPLSFDLAVGEKPTRPVDPDPVEPKVPTPKLKRLKVGKLSGITPVARVTCRATAASDLPDQRAATGLDQGRRQEGPPGAADPVSGTGCRRRS